MTTRTMLWFALVGMVFAWTGPVRAQQPAEPVAKPPAEPAAAATAEPQAEAATEGVPRLELTPAKFDFGEVWQGEPAKADFTVKNTGTAPLEVTVRSGCGCTLAGKPKSPLAPGESSTFGVSYNTATYTGPANKRVTVTTNDPARDRVVIEVEGNVKPLFEATPATRVSMYQLTPDDVETQTVKLVSQYPQPIHLKVKEGQQVDPFDIQLKEIAAGKEYEVQITTKPPLKLGFSRVTLELETGLEAAPTYSIMVAANAQPRVLTMPKQLFVVPSRPGPFTQSLRIQYQAKTPIKILGVESTVEGVTHEMMPSNMPQGQQRFGVHNVRVTLPPYADVPEEGGKLVIYTDDAGEYKTIEVPITRRTGSLTKRAEGVQPPVGAQPIAPGGTTHEQEGGEEPGQSDEIEE